MTSKRQENPQKAISKEWLVQSLSEIMSRKSYKEITITELAAHADLSRRTFYRHFDTIDDVLDYLLDMEIECFVLFFMDSTKSNPYQYDVPFIIRLFFVYWEQRKDYLFTLKDNNLLHLLLDKFFPAVSRRLHTESIEDSTRVYAMAFSIGGIWNMMSKWLENGASLSPDEMQNIAVQIIDHMK